MKFKPTIPSIRPPKGRADTLDLSEARNALGFCTLVIHGVVASSLVIGACGGSLESILITLTLAGALSLLSWTATLLLAAVISIPEVARWLLRRVARRSPRGPRVGGVADEWLDGPCRIRPVEPRLHPSVG